ncbi:hypothetical protein TBLA_0C02070 [Henningerozyma blattae CBS 6284]|uniref:Inositol-3-phosphate synthase n=1 Tax=Henningerozyma blattae (strain ATCC 34711 / CBS 6284 / DSM 70876 / NBRC 10599 / NRRL Y-10934 / UCD 77-7) TaxID=1071380 RepID=I2H0W7_HENB6|nr:hypothetical protein TBLA_0C02070 [Tetrapisispora blattae CBS 6284]CCH60019.1 hypothetical protein TBLA_0C02070 [Tetrapisispora blattae CBS 6284]
MTAQTFVPAVKVQTDKCRYTEDELITKYTYKNVLVDSNQAKTSFDVKIQNEDYEFKTDLKIPKVGVMLVGMGGNNGTTFVASVLANKKKLKFRTKNFKGLKDANYYGSVTQASTVKLGVDSETLNDVYIPFNSLLPMVNPNDFVVSGWDIQDYNCYDAMVESQVLEYDLIQQLKPEMSQIKPLKSIYYPDFLAMNQIERANNCINRKDNSSEVIDIKNKQSDLDHIRNDIKTFKQENHLDKVIVLWTASTERYADIIEGVNDTADNLLNSIKTSHEEIAPSTIFAVASILEGAIYINGSPQNTLVPGVVDLSKRENTIIAGDDFKTGQTKLKSVLAQFLIDAGIKPLSVASYNHLGNNDGYNLSAPKQFRSKEISKSSVIDDMIESNEILYNAKTGAEVDHCIVIKYMPAVGDNKVAMDEYYSELMLGGHNRISVHNVCEDSLLATPIMIDLMVMVEFISRISYKRVNSRDDEELEYSTFNSTLSFLSYWLKAPMVKKGFQPINGLNKQRLALENFLRLLIGLPPNDELRFEERLY